MPTRKSCISLPIPAFILFVFFTLYAHSIEVSLEEPSLEKLTQKNGSLISNWTLEEKVGQLFFLGYRNLDQIKEIKPAGVILFKWSLPNVEATKELTKKITAHAAKELKAPPLIAIDHEGGAVIRLRKGMTPFPDAAAISANEDKYTSFKSGKLMGHELAALGINTNLAPVLDLGNAKSFLENRVWGADPTRVADQTKYFIRGLKSAGILSIAKHFPGHGASSEVNAHFALPKFHKEFSKLWVEDLMPFREAIREDVEALMTAHVAVPNIDPRAPASLSSLFVKDILRKKMGFKGLVVTDDMEMGAVYNQGKNGSVEELALKSIEAGTDIVLIVWSYQKQKKIRDHIVKAVKSGRLSEEMINEKVARILEVKSKYLRQDQNPYWKDLLRHPDSMEFALEISKNAVKWETENSTELTELLLKKWDEKWVVVIPQGSSLYVWKKIRPHDEVMSYSKYLSNQFTEKVKNKLMVSSENKQVMVVITRPLSVMPKSFISTLREQFNQIAKNSSDIKPILWLHQGSAPLQIHKTAGNFNVGLVSLHSSSAKSLLQWAEAFR